MASNRARVVRLSVDAIYASAEAAFLRDDLESCALLLSSCEPETADVRARVSLLRAKLARIRGDDTTWFASARDAARGGAPDDVRLSGLALSALAARRCKGEAEAARLFERLAHECRRAEPIDAAYARYIVALDAWERQDYDSSERLAKENIARVADQSESIALLGWIAVKRERYRESGTFFRRALAIVKRSRPLPVREYGVLVQCVLNAAVETADLAGCFDMAKEFENVPWTPSSALVRFNILGRLRNAALLEGDLERAWFLGRLEASVFQEGPYAALGECAFSAVARALGNDSIADLELRAAWSKLRSVSWGNAHAEQRIALLYFACVGAPCLPHEARQALMLYISVTEKEDPEESLTRDRRVKATECWAAGRVAEALNERAEAISQYRKALTIFTSLEYVTRAADVSLNLLRLTRDAKYRKPIDKLADRAPNAYFVRRAREFEGPLGKSARPSA